MPHGLWETLFYPFYFSWHGRTADNSFRDFRFLIVYVLFVLVGVVWLWRKWRGKPHENLSFTKEWLLYFFVFSYVTWQFSFSIMRYLVALEMLSPLVIYILVRQIIKDHYARAAGLMIIFYVLIFALIPIAAIRAPWYEADFFNVKLPGIVKQTPKATVLMAFPAYALYTHPRPQTYLIPFFPQQWRFVGIPFANGNIFSLKKMSAKK